MPLNAYFTIKKLDLAKETSLPNNITLVIYIHNVTFIKHIKEQ